MEEFKWGEKKSNQDKNKLSRESFYVPRKSGDEQEEDKFFFKTSHREEDFQKQKNEHEERWKREIFELKESRHKELEKEDLDFKDTDGLIDFLRQKDYISQVVALEILISQKTVSLKNLFEIIKSGKDRSVQLAAIESLPKIDNLTREEKESCMKYLCDLSLGKRKWGRCEKDDLDKRWWSEEKTSAYLNYNYEPNLESHASFSILDKAPIVALAQFGLEAEKYLIKIFCSYNFINYPKNKKEGEKPSQEQDSAEEKDQAEEISRSEKEKDLIIEEIREDRKGKKEEYQNAFDNLDVLNDFYMTDDRGYFYDQEDKSFFDDSYDIRSQALKGLAKIGGEKGIAFAISCLGNYKYPWQVYHQEFEDILRNKDKEIVIQKILDALKNATKKESAIRLILKLTDYAKAEDVRKILDQLILANGDNKDKNKKNVEHLRVLITPCDDATAILNLQKFYQDNIKFEQYKINEAMNEREVSLLKSLIDEKDKVLEMGCGTGRLIKELIKDGYDLTGYDFTKRHTEITKGEIEKSGGEAKVFQGDWHENAIKDESLDAVYSLGRNILHDYSIADQMQLFREAARILKPSGKFIFDIPDRTKGGYEKIVKGYAEEMERRGIRNFRFGSIYDSPDGKYFATRYAYSHEDIEELARFSGFKIADIKRLPLETGQGDENLYYVLEKC